MSYQTETEAADHLINSGFKRNETTFTKMSYVENWEGRRPSVAIAYIQHHRVDPCWNSPDFYTIEFL
jgi:hypothetical protein